MYPVDEEWIRSFWFSVKYLKPVKWDSYDPTTLHLDAVLAPNHHCALMIFLDILLLYVRKFVWKAVSLRNVFQYKTFHGEEAIKEL